MTEPYQELGASKTEIRARDYGGLAECDEEFAPGRELPAVARQKAEALADIVVLRLQRKLHIRRDVNDDVRGGDMDVDLSRRQVDERSLITGLQLEILVWAEIQLGLELD